MLLAVPSFIGVLICARFGSLAGSLANDFLLYSCTFTLARSLCPTVVKYSTKVSGWPVLGSSALYCRRCCPKRVSGAKGLITPRCIFKSSASLSRALFCALASGIVAARFASTAPITSFKDCSKVLVITLYRFWPSLPILRYCARRSL